jgi:hypothetical protein
MNSVFEKKWHKDCLKEDLRGMAARKVRNCAQALENGPSEGVYAMKPPTDKEFEEYYLSKLNVYFELWASTWSR